MRRGGAMKKRILAEIDVSARTVVVARDDGAGWVARKIPTRVEAVAAQTEDGRERRDRTDGRNVTGSEPACTPRLVAGGRPSEI